MASYKLIIIDFIIFKIFYKKYITTKHQKISIKNKEGITWSDVIIKKIKKFTHPIKRIK